MLTPFLIAALLAAHIYAAPYVDSSMDILDFVSICGSILFALVGLLM